MTAVPRVGLLIAVLVSSSGCQKAEDRVLMPDSPAVTADSSAGNGSGTPTAGTNAQSQAVRGSVAGTSGAPMAGVAPAGGTGAMGADGVRADSDGTAMDDAGTQSDPGNGDIPQAGTGGSGEDLGGEAGSGVTMPAGGATDVDCDFTGIWIAKQITQSEAIGVAAWSNNWYYFELKQTGDDVEVVKHFDCGIQVTGQVIVSLSRTTTEILTRHNLQAGLRKNKLTKQGDKCVLDGSRFWSIRGADEARFVPNETRDSTDDVEVVAQTKPLPTMQNPDGAVDVELDGELGVRFEAAGALGGIRNSVQRDWTRWFTEPGFEITASPDWPNDLLVRVDFDNEEVVLAYSQPLLASGSVPTAGAKHQLKLRFLGRDASDPRVTAVVQSADVDTCYAIQDTFPAEELR